MQYNGALILDKPQGFTSFDAVAVMRRLCHEKKVGHTGTLDPMATGVLVVLVGRAPRAAAFLADSAQAYEAGFRFGVGTATPASTGKVLRSSDTPVPRAALEAVMERFRGNIFQTPPMYSAVSVHGQRLYTLARRGLAVEREKRPVTVAALTLLRYDEARREGAFFIDCSKGTYVRTLCADIGEALGAYGVMTSLRRVRACGFSLSDAVSLEEARALGEAGRLGERIRPVDSLFPGLRRVTVSQKQAVRFQNGGALDLGRLPALRGPVRNRERIRVYAPDERFLGLGELREETAELGTLKLF